MADPVQQLLIAERRAFLERSGLTRSKLRRFKPRLPEPRAQALRYMARLRGLQRRVNQVLREGFLTLTRMIVDLREDSVRMDTLDDLIDSHVAMLEQEINQFLDPGQIQIGITDQGEKIFAHNHAKYDKSVFNLIGVNDIPGGKLGEILKGWTNENLEHISDINANQVSKLRSLMLRSAQDGRRAKDIEADVRKIFNVSERRAALIARDQTLKLSGQIDRAKQTNAGITRYIWRTSLDDRVRPEHEEREGVKFSWDAPPPDGHPGQPINCRCTAEPDIEFLIGAG